MKTHSWFLSIRMTWEIVHQGKRINLRDGIKEVIMGVMQKCILDMKQSQPFCWHLGIYM